MARLFEHRGELVAFVKQLRKCATLEEAIDLMRARLAGPVGASGEPAVQQLLAALKSVTEHMDRAGGDAYAMPECPWCHAQGDDKDQHFGDCELAAARELIAEIKGAAAVVPSPPVADDWKALFEQAEDMLLRVELVRQAGGTKYACPFCKCISERDGGPGHAEDCEWKALIIGRRVVARSTPPSPPSD
jgi:hypothetical protein